MRSPDTGDKKRSNGRNQIENKGNESWYFRGVLNIMNMKTTDLRSCMISDHTENIIQGHR